MKRLFLFSFLLYGFNAASAEFDDISLNDADDACFADYAGRASMCSANFYHDSSRLNNCFAVSENELRVCCQHTPGTTGDCTAEVD